MLSKVDYSPHINDVFFANILPLPIGYSSCPADSLIQLNNESNIDYVLMHSSCSGLAVSGFRFTPGSLEHVIYISGESSPLTPDPIFYDAKMSVYSTMNFDMEQLNQFIAILRPDNGFAVSTGFWSDRKVEAHIPKAAFSLLGTYFTAPLHVNTNGITMSAEATLFEKFDAQFMGYVPLGYTWNDFLFQLNGVFKTGPSSFVDGVQSYIYDHAEVKVSLATERVSNAEAVKSKTLQLIEDYTDIVANKQTELQNLQNEYTSIVNKISTVNSTVQQAQTELDLANEEVFAAVGKVTAVCDYADCDEVCLPVPSLSSCDTQVTNDEWGISKVTTLDQILQNTFDTVTENKWHIDYTCRIITNIKGWAETTFGQVCSYKSIIGDVASEKWFTYYDWVNVSHIQPSVIDTHMYSISQTCSQEDSCGTKLQNIECTYLNVGCQLAQQPAIDALTEAEKALIKPMQLLNQAKTNLTIALAELAAISTKIDSAQHGYDKASMTLQGLQVMQTNDESNYENILAEQQPLLQLGTFLESYTIEQLLNIQNISFQVEITDTSPYSFPVSIAYTIPQYDTSHSISLSPDFSATLPILYRRIADDLLTSLGMQLENVSGKRKRSMVELMFNEKTFEENCGKLQNVKEYVKNINKSLNTALNISNEVKQNITSIVSSIDTVISVNSLTFSNIDFAFLQEEYSYTITPEDLLIASQAQDVIINLVSILEDLKDYVNSLTETVNEDLFIEWQSGFETSFGVSKFNSIGNQKCYSLTDCLTTAVHIIQELLEDAPDSVTQDLLPNLQSAKESIINLGLSSNLNINNAPSKTAGIYNIILLLESTNYWCAGLPVITIHPDSNTHVKINSDFTLVCEAESELDISYSWKKDGFIIPGSKNNNLTISNTVLQNEGQYQCFVSNAVGTVESMFANVVVYTVPEITLSPSRQEVFEGSDNGGVFICNATAHPSPRFEWQFSSDGGDSWLSINSSSNELVVIKPTQNQEGWYRCKAFLGSDEAYSESAFLKVYAAAISHLSFPVDFYMSVLSTFPEITDSYIKGLKTSLIDTLDSELNMTYGEIRNLDLSFGYQNTIVKVSMILTTSFDYKLDSLISDQALEAKYYKQDILAGISRLERNIENGVLSFSYEESFYVSIGLTLVINDLQYQCQPGKALQHSNFFCSKWIFV